MKTCNHEPKLKEKPIDHDKYPIIVHLANGRCLIWDNQKQDWMIKVNHILLSEKEKMKIIPIFRCWCGSSFWTKSNLTTYEEKIVEKNLISFQKKHERCGFKKNNHKISISNFLIKEEGE